MPDRAVASLGVDVLDAAAINTKRPRKRTSPSVGSVIRERIFSNVDLPAPLQPMIPSRSPG